MPHIYKNLFYNHFENQSYKAKVEDFPTNYKSEENLLLRYKARIPYFNFHQNSLTIRYFKQGSGELMLKDRRLKVRDEDFLILNPNDGWEFINERNDYIDVLSFGISNSLISQCNFYLQEENEKILSDPLGETSHDTFFIESPLKAKHYASGQLLQFIYGLSNQDDFKLTCPDELTIEILQSIYREQKLGNKIEKEIQAKKSVTKKETFRRLLLAYEYIHDNVGTHISIEQLSFVSSLSKFHLYNSFKMAFGKTPHQYINRLKVSKAKELVKTGKLSISEVSDSLGFSDLSVFSKVFKKVYGHPPSYYMN
ncbi:helix-turn-helix domain-containing protein [Maribacter sp. 2210JD10-5]|uniref:helix-turn-helix domain-containing protein n=1 Tax=Maribacter sp. 2210JD10-5 TaxID=3386272 RepID=UPI0039BCA331